jgi:hypothetical protein
VAETSSSSTNNLAEFCTMCKIDRPGHSRFGNALAVENSSFMKGVLGMRMERFARTFLCLVESNWKLLFIAKTAWKKRNRVLMI